MDLTRSKIWTVAMGLVLLGIVLHLVRKRKLKEEYALLWIAMGLTGILLASWRGLVFAFSFAIGIADPANAFFLLSLLFLIVILIHFSVVVSETTEKTRILAQEVALLRWENERLERDIKRLEQREAPRA